MINLYTLSVDDEPDIREIIELALGLDPLFTVRDCPSGHDAVKDALEWRPDLILLDVMMPIMDGPATLAKLRADRRTAMIPVVFMTARAQTHERERFKSLGAAGVIAKPFDPLRLPTLLRECLSAAGAPTEDFRRRLNDARMTLAACRENLAREREHGTLACIKDLAQALAGNGRTHGFAGLSLQSTALEEAANDEIAGHGHPIRVDHALDRILSRIQPQ
jgi:CheY-like chemotaxis protein